MLILAALLAGSLAGSQPTWSCVNEIEIWCTGDHCAAAPPGEFTPLSITADPRGGFSICAYTGCWESDVRPRRFAGRALWIADSVPFSTARDGAMTADATLLILEKDRVGFARVGGLATPLRCSLRPLIEE